MIAVKTALAQDWELIRDVRLRSLEDSPEAFTSNYAREAAFDEITWRDRASTCRWFVAFDGSQSVGVAGGLLAVPEQPGTRELVGMWVAPTHRGRGIARLLLDAVGRWASSDGASLLTLGVRESNRRAQAAYLSMGLQSTGDFVAERGQSGRSIEIMDLNLRPGLPM